MWYEYAKVLYNIHGQPPLPHSHGSRLSESTFFTLQNVRNTIDRLQFGKVAEHFIYSCDTLLPLLTHIFNRAMSEDPTRWTEHIIVPIFKRGDSMMLSNYRTIMIGHYRLNIWLDPRVRNENMGREKWLPFS